MRFLADDFDFSSEEPDVWDGLHIGRANHRGVMETPISRAALDNDWPVYVEAVNERLENGCRVYGDSSFDRDPYSLISEIQDELKDVAGWSFILWKRLETLRAKLAAVKTA